MKPPPSAAYFLDAADVIPYHKPILITLETVSEVLALLAQYFYDH